MQYSLTMNNTDPTEITGASSRLWTEDKPFRVLWRSRRTSQDFHAYFDRKEDAEWFARRHSVGAADCVVEVSPRCALEA